MLEAWLAKPLDRMKRSKQLHVDRNNLNLHHTDLPRAWLQAPKVTPPDYYYFYTAIRETNMMKIQTSSSFQYKLLTVSQREFAAELLNWCQERR